MPTQKMGKSLPKRCSNAHAKEQRKVDWARGEKRKDARRKAAEAAHKRNLELVAAGGVSPGGRTSWPRKRLSGADRDPIRPARWVIELPRDPRIMGRR